jgi:hypothetical protein
MSMVFTLVFTGVYPELVEGSLFVGSGTKLPNEDLKVSCGRIKIRI